MVPPVLSPSCWLTTFMGPHCQVFIAVLQVLQVCVYVCAPEILCGPNMEWCHVHRSAWLCVMIHNHRLYTQRLSIQFRVYTEASTCMKFILHDLRDTATHTVKNSIVSSPLNQWKCYSILHHAWPSHRCTMYTCIHLHLPAPKQRYVYS